MRILHTSDWHVGRTFHGHQTLTALDAVLAELADQVADHAVDVVVLAGDVFDTAVPSPAAYRTLAAALARIQAAGAQIVLTSGNHDSPARLGFLAAFTEAGGLHIHTDPARLAVPTVLSDAYGEVKFFGIPYLEPALLRHLPGAADVASQAAAMRWATDQIRAALAPTDRAVVIAHTFAARTATDADREPDDLGPDAAPRDFTRGGVDVVPLECLAGFTYTALGHLHSRSQLAPTVRYSGAPLHYSFSEANKPRGSWLVELGPLGFLSAEWLNLPVPRPLVELRGTVEELRTEPSYVQYEDHWVRGILTDNVRVVEPVRRLKQRFPFFADVVFAPDQVNRPTQNYRERVRGKTGQVRDDEEIADVFAKSVRNGFGLDSRERALLIEVMETVRAGHGR